MISKFLFFSMIRIIGYTYIYSDVVEKVSNQTLVEIGQLFKIIKIYHTIFIHSVICKTH